MATGPNGPLWIVVHGGRPKGVGPNDLLWTIVYGADRPKLPPRHCPVGGDSALVFHSSTLWYELSPNMHLHHLKKGLGFASGATRHRSVSTMTWELFIEVVDSPRLGSEVLHLRVQLRGQDAPQQCLQEAEAPRRAWKVSGKAAINARLVQGIILALHGLVDGQPL
ncbi:hypothetical protein GW17_00051681 [Ensete ventricosum]|nr:hypothetical protein GW17_00051681 [Ensete ventricosum]